MMRVAVLALFLRPSNAACVHGPSIVADSTMSGSTVAVVDHSTPSLVALNNISTPMRRVVQHGTTLIDLPERPDLPYDGVSHTHTWMGKLDNYPYEATENPDYAGPDLPS